MSIPFSSISPDEAVSHIQDGDFVVLSHAAAVPQACVAALARNYERFHGVRIFHMVTLGESPYTAPEMEGHFRLVTNFVGANTRPAVDEQRADFVPSYFYEVPSMMQPGGVFHPDVAIVQLSYPNEEGYCSFGTSCDYSKPAAEQARVVIGELNKQMPFVGGDNLIHISQLTHIVEADYPLYALDLPRIGEVEEAIGRHCAELIQDGDTLQLGIGAIPDAVLLFLKDKKDLGIHSEMVSDGVVKLIKANTITGRRKTLLPNKVVATFLMGTQELYDFAHNNPAIEMRPVNYVNDPRIIAQNDHLVSINSCIEVDLMGQVVSEAMGLRQFSGPGGQVDFVRGAAWSKGGRSIIAIPSTARRGTASRIVPLLTEGAAITTSRNDVDYIVTEYGVAHLKGKSLRERALALTAIAHPNFRPELEAECKRRFKL